jgi:protein TonB
MNNDRRLCLAIVVSLLLHGVALSLHFGFPEASRALRNKALDIVLVNARSERKPKDAQVLAQANLDGGGSSDEERIASTPLPPSPREQVGDQLEQAQRRMQALEAQRRHLLAQTARNEKASSPTETVTSPREHTPSSETSEIDGLDMSSRALEMARLEGSIARQTDELNNWPRVKRIGTRAEEYRFARYVEDWQNKVQRIGDLNYPEAARGKLSGSLILTVRIKSNGDLERVEIDKSSGHRVLDEGATRIAHLSAPFAEFPPDIRREYDVLEITRRWTFTSSNQLQTTVK